MTRIDRHRGLSSLDSRPSPRQLRGAAAAPRSRTRGYSVRDGGPRDWLVVLYQRTTSPRGSKPPRGHGLERLRIPGDAAQDVRSRFRPQNKVVRALTTRRLRELACGARIADKVRRRRESACWRWAAATARSTARASTDAAPLCSRVEGVHQVAVVDLLLAAGADASSTPAMEGSAVLPPLHFAVSLGRREEEAVKDRRYQVVIHLLRHGAQAAAEDANHVTAEARARQYRQFRCEKLLRAVRLAGGSWEQYIGPRYELVALRALCAGERRGRAGPAVWAKNCSSEVSSLPICQKNCSERSCRSGLRSGTNVIHTINKLGRCFLLERLPLREQQLPARAGVSTPSSDRSSERPHDVVRRDVATSTRTAAARATRRI